MCLRYGVLFASSLDLFSFLILVFHLKQKHEEGQRLLHYLQHTNDYLAKCTAICVINQEYYESLMKAEQSCVFREDIRYKIIFRNA